MNIILIGFMGVGKSTVGRLLASELALSLLDTDQLIEQTEARAISEIFRTDGEEHFRGLETEVLETLQDYDNFVLSTGGGIVLKEENVALLKTMGPIILLTADPAVIYERIKNETHRPLLETADPQAEITRILERRRPFYARAAEHTVDTSQAAPGEAAKEIITWLRSK
jgi:shikimate kinase